MYTWNLFRIGVLTHVAPRGHTAHMTSGLDLKLKRVAADINVGELAAAYDPPVTNSRISHLERVRIVTPEAEAKYLAALSKCVTKSTTPAEAA